MTLLRLLLVAAVTAMVALGSPDAGVPVADPGPDGLTLTATTDRTDLENAVIKLTNKRRTEHGCGVGVRYRWTLVKAARGHSERMADAHTMSHRLPGEAPLGKRITRAGYTGWTQVGENIAYGYTRAWKVVRAWMRSAPHRHAMLDCRYRHIGVGLVRSNGVSWWTMDLGRKW